MDRLDPILARTIARRRLLALAGLAGGGALAGASAGGNVVRLLMNGGPAERPMAPVFPEKQAMIVQRVRPPLLETPMAVFDRGVFTPNDQFYVRWHWGDIPLDVDVAAFRLNVRGAVERPLSLSLAEILRLPRVSLAAVNQCSGNSRAFFEPRVPGAQWSHGAMGNAVWEGVSLKAILDQAGIRAGAAAVRFGGLDRPLTDVDPYRKSLAIDHARAGEAMVAFAMNGEQLPMLNGFPLRLVVPGHYSTYWMKALNEIEVLTAPDEGYWMARAYKIPTTPGANVAPGAHDFPTTPINSMVARSWITNVSDGATLPLQPWLPVGGIAMGGDKGVAKVEVSGSGGATWTEARLGPDEGRYSFRRFDADIPLATGGPLALMSRCTDSAGRVQPMTPNWNPGGYMRACVETTHVTIA
ncbi:MAG TPA: molybdopterin-dependent oxidoreductase [Allosphingosinicella sp.]|jgi:DMSO/TMAO reductase YedYZ molybdopterin-dependent catalytic subunit